MNLLKTILVIGFAMMLISCGENKGGDTVKVAKMENGVAKAEDGRIILSSESSALVIPRGSLLEGIEINSMALSSIIEEKVEVVSSVYNLSFKVGISLDNLEEQAGDWVADIKSFIAETIPILGKTIEDADISLPFIISFSVNTHPSQNRPSQTFDNIECSSQIVKESESSFQLGLQDCGSDVAVLKKEMIWVDVNNIVVDPEQLKAAQRSVLE